MKSKVLDSQKVPQPAEDNIWVHNFDENAAQKFGDRVLKIAARDPQEPIVIYVDSYGGYIDGLATMISVMDSVINPFITVATGKAMSAGAILLSHGDIRCVGIHARIMVHEALGGAGGNVNDVQNDASELQRINDHFMAILAKNCGKSLQQLKTLWKDRRDLYLTANEAVRFGIADHVGLPTIEKQTAFHMHFLKHVRPPKGKKVKAKTK